MKIFKSLAMLCSVAVCAMMMSSCESDPVTKVYGLGIYEWQSSGSGSVTGDMSAVEQYLNSHGCPTSGEERIWMITSTSVEKCDKEAAARFKTLVKDLSQSEVSLLVGSDCKFMYGCARSEGPDSETVYVGEWRYPAE